MIGFIRGKIMNISESSITVGDSVGFSINISPDGFSLNEEVEIYTHMIVRENDISLWGFRSEKELNIFRLLINISGVGPRTAQSLICKIGIRTIISSVVNEKPELLKTTGVGIKTAQKIVIEMQNKLKSEEYSEKDEESIFPENSVAQDVISALQTLGYRESDLIPIVSKIIKMNPEITSTEEIIKKVLISI